MPRLDRGAAGAGPAIQGFSGTGFRIDGRLFPRGALLTPEMAADWSPPPIKALSEDDLAFLLTLDPTPEFILLGTGATLVRPPAALMRSLETRGLGLEAMDSRTAARAWGLLRGEGRHIAAALMPLG